ncbi:hypothetical protein AWB75_02014 [Caballeronia catudaia]|uniref:Uncharacterized protein n=1 Tax=Caballeronia catudaia TaxID=1777136 RepID=A0A158ACB9_9BURK|nr:hypothetical protein AWB75_02014 [Caballeronia catudaia]
MFRPNELFGNVRRVALCALRLETTAYNHTRRIPSDWHQPVPDLRANGGAGQKPRCARIGASLFLEGYCGLADGASIEGGVMSVGTPL